MRPCVCVFVKPFVIEVFFVVWQFLRSKIPTTWWAWWYDVPWGHNSQYMCSIHLQFPSCLETEKAASNKLSTCRWFHYIDVIMAAIASQITSLTIVYSTIYSDADQWRHHISASLAFLTGEFPAQMVSNAENVSIWWRHHGMSSSPTPVWDSLDIDVWTANNQ